MYQQYTKLFLSAVVGSATAVILIKQIENYQRTSGNTRKPA